MPIDLSIQIDVSVVTATNIMIPTHISKLPSVGVWLSMFFVLTFQRNNGMNPGKHWDVFSKTPRLFPGEGGGRGGYARGYSVISLTARI